MLGDALVYGFSIYVVARGERLKAIAAFKQGGIMVTFGLFVLGCLPRKILRAPQLPVR